MSESEAHRAVYHEYEDNGWHRVDPHMQDALLSGEAVVTHTAAGRRYTVNMATLTQVNASTGKSRQLRRRERATPRKDIQERIRACHERRAAVAASGYRDALVSFVSAWAKPDAESVEPLVVVRQIGAGDEFDRVQLALGALSAVTVERVENYALMDRFVHALAMHELECDVSGEDAPGVRLMFHGCRGGRASEVQVMRLGLEPLYSARRDSQHAFGAGAYMSATADFSVKGYSYADSEGARSVLVFLCVTGRVARGDQAMVERPPGVVALVDNVASPTIFSYANAAFLYPAYRVRVEAQAPVQTQIAQVPVPVQPMLPHESIAQMIRQLGAGGFRQLVKSCGISKHATITPALLMQMKQAHALLGAAAVPVQSVATQAPVVRQQQQQLMQAGITGMYRQLGAAGLRQLVADCGSNPMTPALLAQVPPHQQPPAQVPPVQVPPPPQQPPPWVRKRRVDKYTGDRDGMVYGVVDGKCRYAPRAGLTAAGSEFVPCTTNVGAMEGHSFAVGAHGLGYYDLARVPYTALAEPPPYYYGLRTPRKGIVKELQRRAATKPYAQCVAEMAREGGVFLK